MVATCHITQFNNSYRRYIGPLGEQLHAMHGMNPSTHVASVCLNPAEPNKAERAVVKWFDHGDYGWLNEYAAWILAQELGVKTTPRAALLIGQPKDVSQDHCNELRSATRYSSGPMVLWCTSAVEPTKPVQQALGRNWETTALRLDSGRRMGAMDGWIGNCDRIDANTLYWTSGTGGLVAIDHEKMVFSQNWTQHPPQHPDEQTDASGQPKLTTRLIDAIHKARKSTDKAIKKAASTAASEMFGISQRDHGRALASAKPMLQALTQQNFGPQAWGNLLSFLDYRSSEDSLKQRYRILT